MFWDMLCALLTFLLHCSHFLLYLAVLPPQLGCVNTQHAPIHHVRHSFLPEYEIVWYAGSISGMLQEARRCKLARKVHRMFV
jgi:hypothetical protein